MSDKAYMLILVIWIICAVISNLTRTDFAVYVVLATVVIIAMVEAFRKDEKE